MAAWDVTVLTFLPKNIPAGSLSLSSFMVYLFLAYSFFFFLIFMHVFGCVSVGEHVRR